MKRQTQTNRSRMTQGAVTGILFLVVLAIALWAGLAPPSMGQGMLQSGTRAIAPAELRGVWLTNIDSDVLFSQRNVQAGLQRLDRLNFNTVYPTVWNWGYTLYPSAVAEQAIGEAVDPHPALAGRDLLQEVVEEGHRLGLTVMPWFEFGLMTPSYSELARRHPDWITARTDGSTVVMQGRHPRRWLNPLHPEVQNLLLGMVTEVVSRYDVDGIQLDDHFGLPVELGYDTYTVEQYRVEHDGDRPPNDPQDPEWVAWRAAKITALMERLVGAVHTIKPDCLISLSPNPYPYAYDAFLQDWPTWLERGWLDELIVQVYRSSLDTFVEALEQPEIRSVKDRLPVSIGILTGVKDRSTPFELIRNQVRAARDRRYAGVSFFFYESLGDRDAAFQSLFVESVDRP